MMPADLIYVLSDERQRVALNRVRADRMAALERRVRYRARRTHECTS
jgi:hypothetical protein